jgi:hypothetical protein
MTDGIEETELQAIEEPVIEPVSADDDDAQKPKFNSRQVSDVVKREKQKAYERGKREAMEQLQEQQQQQQAQQLQQQQTIGGMQQMSQDDIRRMISEQAPHVLQEQVNQLKTEHVVNSFVSKMQAAEQKYPGLQDKLADLDYRSLAPLVEMANDMPNTADVMKELMDHPSKMGSLMMLLSAQPKLAHREMMSLSSSIQANEEAKTKEKQAQDPLTSLKQSVGGGGDKSSTSMRDLQSMLRGMR